MSALAARRAAAAARLSAPSSTASSPGLSAPSSVTHRVTRVKDGAGANSGPEEGGISVESTRAMEGGADEDLPGPSKRQRVVSDTATQVRIVEPSVSSRRADTGAKGKGKDARKRAFSPSGPMMSSDEGISDEDGLDSDQGGVSDAAEATEENEVLDEGITPYGTPGPWQPRMAENTAAVSRFTPRRGHNVELLSSAGLDKAGVPGRGNGLLLSLGADEDIFLAGTFDLTVLSGQVTFAGTVLSPSPRDHPVSVSSPITHAVPAITYCPSSASSTIPSVLLGKLRLAPTFDMPNRAVVLVRGNATGLNGMRRGAVPGFATAWGDEKGWMGIPGVHSIPGSIIAPCYPYQQPDSWTDALSVIRQDGIDCVTQTAPIVLAKGPKRSGKSTIARAALNNLLQVYQRVAWLECDLGQGEFGCGGVIGLWILDEPVYGPAFTHPRVPLKAHFLGTYTPLTCPDEYLAAIDHLLHVYRYELDIAKPSLLQPEAAKRGDAIPLVVNTQGWVKGLGEELLRSIEGLAQATHVLAFDQPNPDAEDGERNGWTGSPTLGITDLPPSYLGEQPKVFSLEQAPITPLQQRYTAADHRNLSTLAYLHASLSTNGAGTSWDFTTPMIAIPPLEVTVSADGPIKAVYMQGEGADGISPLDLPLALTGSVVALIEDKSDAFTECEPLTYVQARPLPSLESSTFLGLAVVRAVLPSSDDTDKSLKLHVITPLPAEALSRANAIVRNGAMELPTPAMLDWRSGTGGISEEGLVGVPWSDVPFFDTDAGGVGIEKRRVRRNLMRKGM